MNPIGRRASLGAIAGLVLSGTSAFAAETPPSTIRLAAVSAGYGKPFGLAVIGIVQARKLIEAELKAANVRVAWTFPDGAGPAINEGIASGQIDFAAYGDLPNIIGRAGGLPTRVIASRGAEIIYVAVRNGVRAQTIADLKGLRVTLQRGTILHQAFDRLLGESGLTESDIQLFDLKTQDQNPAIAAGDVDAVVGTVTLLNLRDQGLVRIIYTTRGKVTPDGFGAFVVAEDFARRYPATTQAVVRAYVKAARWAGDERNRAAALAIWGLAGTPQAVLAESFRGVNLRNQLDPRLDAFYLATLKSEVAFAQANKLIRSPVDVDAWIDRSYVTAAIRDLDLASFWPPRTSSAHA
jgi:sulfonate transport system substrate-binding protein